MHGNSNILPNTRKDTFTTEAGGGEIADSHTKVGKGPPGLLRSIPPGKLTILRLQGENQSSRCLYLLT